MLPTDPFDTLMAVQSVTTHSSPRVVDHAREFSLEVKESSCVPTGGRICLIQLDNLDSSDAVNLAVLKFLWWLTPDKHYGRCCGGNISLPACWLPAMFICSR